MSHAPVAEICPITTLNKMQASTPGTVIYGK
jgi:hypothetical protein